MQTKVVNFVLFQIGWFACVLGGAYLYPLAGTLIAILIVAFHIKHSIKPQHELILILMAVLIGTVWDSLLVAMDLLSYTSGIVVDDMAPYWIIALWALFATTLNVSLGWLKGQWVIAVLSGAIAGPLAYYAGHRLGAVVFNDMHTALIMLGMGWSVFVPLLLWLAQRYDGYQLSSGQQGATG